MGAALCFVAVDAKVVVLAAEAPIPIRLRGDRTLPRGRLFAVGPRPLQPLWLCPDRNPVGHPEDVCSNPHITLLLVQIVDIYHVHAFTLKPYMLLN